jgi:sugar lactone lactonase YvrE
MLTTVVGNGTSGFSGDNGPATNASISTANGLCVDRQNNLYFADSGGIGHIRKVDLSTGIITRFAGNGHYTFNGDSINADTAGFICSYNMKCDVLGNIYFSEYSNHRVRVIDNNHIIHTIAGTGVAGYSGDNGSATFAEISHPSGVALDTCGNVYIADYFNKRIRKVSLNPNCWPLAVDDAQQNKPLTIYPNPTTCTLHIDNLKAPATYTLYDITGRVVASSRLTTGQNEINTTHLSSGIYLLHLLHNDGTREVHKIVKD